MKPVLILPICFITALPAGDLSNARPPANDNELKYWLENMIWYHDFSLDEIESATGLNPAEIQAAQARWNITPETKPDVSQRKTLLVLPYPGGRHPRTGFLEGAIHPQRETKISVFLPWNPKDYVVVDIPEAIWSNLGLTYLAHTHVQTIWDKNGIQLKPQEWERRPDGSLRMERTLPNGIRFGTSVVPKANYVQMEMWLYNGTSKRLTDLRVQNCVMLREAEDFNQLTPDNKVVRKPYVAVRNPAGDHWIITAWEPCHRPWNNPRCPCLHSDPKFPDCDPGETQHLKGWLSFYQGTDVNQEFDRINHVWKNE